MSDNLRVVDEFLIDPTLMSVEPTPIQISEPMKRTINTAEEREVPMVFAYIDEK